MLCVRLVSPQLSLGACIIIIIHLFSLSQPSPFCFLKFVDHVLCYLLHYNTDSPPVSTHMIFEL